MRKLFTLCCMLAVVITEAQTGNVGIGTSTPLARLHVAGDQIIDSTLQFTIVPEYDMPAMINMFTAGTQNKDRMFLAHSPSYTNWGLQYQDSTDKFNFLSGGTPVLTADLGSWRVGVGTSDPAVRFDIGGTGAYNLASSEGDFRLGDETYRLKMGVANAGGGAGDAYLASSNRLYLGAGSTLGRTQTMSINSNGMVGIGTASPGARLHIVGDTFTVPVIQATVSYTGTENVRGITSVSIPGDGWGYGIEGTGGLMGGYFSGASGASSGTGYGVFGTASGTAGTRIGVYGTASGGTINNWGGYFPVKTFTNELRVGSEVGVAGNVASINGKMSINGGSADAFTIINGGDIRIQDDPGTSSVLVYAGAPASTGANKAILTVLSDGKTFTFNGTGGAVSSDERLKQDIVPLNNSLQKLMQLNGYSYRFKTKADDQQKEIGVLAQEVKKVLPDAVYTDDKGMYSVSYNSLVPLLINAVKEQQAEIEKLQQKLNKQQELEKRLAQLEATILKQ